MSQDKYTIVRTLEGLFMMDKHLSSPHEYVAVDTETNGLHFWKNVVVGFSISTDDQSGYYVPLLEWLPLGEAKSGTLKGSSYNIVSDGCFIDVWTGQDYPENVTHAEYSAPLFIKEFIAKWLIGQKLLMHNAVFDVLMIEATFGVNLESYVFCDTGLLKHILDENSSNSLKEIAISWQSELGFDAKDAANKEQLEMKASVISNGGKFTKGEKHIWRADPELLGKYAVADTFLTYGIFKVGMAKLVSREEPEKYLRWFFEDEVMPLCREVIINMKRRGVRIDDEYFKCLEKETYKYLDDLEDLIMDTLSDTLRGFSIGTSMDDAVSKKVLVEKIIELEGLEYPVFQSTKNKGKKSLSKSVVSKIHAQEPHWLWGYLLGEDEIRYSDKKISKIKQEIYIQKEGRRYHFNLGSDNHLRWLFCEKLGYDPEKLPQTDAAINFNRQKSSDEEKKVIPSMKAEVLKDFFLKDHEFVKYILLWKKLKKLLVTYICPAVELSHNGYLHMDFVQNGTSSGRFACRGGFNLQTLPRVEELDRCPKCGSKDIVTENPIKLIANIRCTCGYQEDGLLCSSAIKAGFIAPEGMRIVNADYSSLEPRVFAFMSGDIKLKQIYWEDLDMYSKVYCDIEDPEGLYSPDPKAPNYLKKQANHLRTMVKPVCLGIAYGCRAPQTANLMGFKRKWTDKNGQEHETLDIKRGGEFRDKYLATYPDLHKYMLESENEALTKGYVETLVGRRRHYKTTIPIHNLLLAANKDVDWFLDLKNSEVEVFEINEIFNKDTLKNLFDTININPYDEGGVPRNWGFVRAIFKNELNNSKNFRIQGLGAHIANRAMLDITRSLKAKGLDAYVGLQVHDEVTGYASQNHVDEVAKLWKYHMEHNIYSALVDIDMVADPIICDNIKDAK